jgi:hypothetical protein
MREVENNKAAINSSPKNKKIRKTTISINNRSSPPEAANLKAIREYSAIQL